MAQTAPQTSAGPGADAVRLLSELIRIDTSNPPGNEGPAQELLAGVLSEAGFECELLAAIPGRPNLVARLPGSEPGPVLGLLSHVDTVPADPAEWSFDPWSGEVRDGRVLGRGGQDMKDQVAAEVAAAAWLAREGWRPQRGELRIFVTADEETGAHHGAQWLVREHPDKAYADWVVNEGAGAMFEVGGKRFYGLSVGEKGVFRFWLRARGRAGHGSVPGLGDNALLRLAPALVRFSEQPPLEPTAPGIEFLRHTLGRELGSDPAELAAAVEELGRVAPELVTYIVEPMLRVTLVPTRIEASQKDNVIPARAQAVIDTRVPPGLGEDYVRERIAGVLGEHAERLEIEFIEKVVGNQSPFDSPLTDAIRAWLAKADPEATLVPTVMAGFSDSRWWRAAFDSSVVYGFHPQREIDLFESAPLVHGADELAAVSDVEFAADFFADLPRRLLGG